MRYKALVRTDGSTEIGFGHAMRCLSLAGGLEEEGIRVHFVSKDYGSKILDKISDAGFNLLRLDSSSSSKEDARIVVDFAKAEGIDFIVTDSYNITSGDLRLFKEQGFFLVSIDDLAKIDFVSDIVLNQNINVNSKDYEGKIKDYTRLLIGPKYALLRKEFQDKSNEKQIRDLVQNILVTFGGGDRHNQTLKTIRAVMGLKNDWNIDIVVGSGYPYLRELESLAKKDAQRINIYQDTNNIAKLMAKADIAVTAAGTTVWELCCLGVPTIIIACANNQILLAQGLKSRKIMLNLGWYEDIDEEDIASSIEKLSEDKKARLELSRRSRKLVDGKGMQRVVREVLKMFVKRKCNNSQRGRYDKNKAW